MTVGTDLWNRPFARKELLPVTIQTGCMFGKFSYIKKRHIALPNLLPVFGGKLVTRGTSECLFVDVCGMREARVITHWLDTAGLRTALRLSRRDGQSNSDYKKCSQA